MTIRRVTRKKTSPAFQFVQAAEKPVMNAQMEESWLANGWILEVADEFLGDADCSRFWLGWDIAGSFDPHELDSRDGLWTPEFFDLKTEPAGASRGCLQVSRDDLRTWLAAAGYDGVGATERVAWTEPSRATFASGWEFMQQGFRSGARKFVPAVFARGLCATDDRRKWLAARLHAGLAATEGNRLRLYGRWSAEHGCIGATPEALFSLQHGRVGTMAVAGTRPRGRRAELLTDGKEQTEHRLVVDDIAAVLRTTSGATDSVAIHTAETRAVDFGALSHLVTDITATGGFRGCDLTKALHPTPALGLAPRSLGLTPLRELHSLVASGFDRGRFGAPFVASLAERVEAVVAIRQVRWRELAGDRLELEIGSGCGVLPASTFEQEWQELSSKREAVMAMFRLGSERADTLRGEQNLRWAFLVLEQLLLGGVRAFAVCAGARNAPLVIAIEALRLAARERGAAIDVISFFDERAAAFFALGKARGSNRPVAVVTTSGTAATELHSALAEADLSGVPLIAVTADRPKRLRSSGAPQSLRQDGLFRHFVEREWDLEIGAAADSIDLRALSLQRPVHLNLCFEEPLYVQGDAADALVSACASDLAAHLAPTAPPRAAATPPPTLLPSPRLQTWAREPLCGFAIVGSLREHEIEAVAEFLRRERVPAYLEGPSGLRGDPRLVDLEILGGEAVLSEWLKSGDANCVLRIGGVPTARIWRDLDDPKLAARTISVSSLRFPGLSRGELLSGPIDAGLAVVSELGFDLGVSWRERWQRRDRQHAERLRHALDENPCSEPSILRQLSLLIGDNAAVYVGNSLPIREWDLAAARKPIRVEANRGVNGIDGQISTALGMAHGRTNRDLWVIVGDLTALYDATGLWPVLQNSASWGRLRLVIINNGGGKIFSKVLAAAPGGAAPFENAHAVGFQNFAALWQLAYLQVNGDESRAGEVGEQLLAAQNHERILLEIKPSALQTEQLWSALAAPLESGLPE